jgi:hypothetical protein
MIFTKEIYIIIALLICLASAIITWKLSNYFISRSQHYRKSKYDILMKKLGWSLGVFVLLFYIFIDVLKKYVE